MSETNYFRRFGMLHTSKIAANWTPQDAATQYGGRWRYDTWNNYYCQITFWGTQASWIGPLRADAGIGRIKIDGEEITTVDQYNATTLQNQVIYTTPVLELGEHVLRVEVTNTKNPASSSVRLYANSFDVYNAGIVRRPFERVEVRWGSSPAAWTNVAAGGAYGGRTLRSSSTTSQMCYAVYAQKIAWIGRKGSDAGIATVYLDGEEIEDVDCYAADYAHQQTLWESDLLELGIHWIRIVPKGTKNPSSSNTLIYVDAFDCWNPMVDYESEVSLNHTVFGYSDSWTETVREDYFMGRMLNTATTDAVADYRFFGDGVALYGRKSADYGIAEILLDGVSQGNVDMYASPAEYQTLLWASGPLTQEQHDVRIRCTGTRNPLSSANWVGIDYVKVFNAPRPGGSGDLKRIVPGFPVERVFPPVPTQRVFPL